MARWHDEDRWTSERERLGEEDRRWRGERGGEEGGWRGRDWRSDERRGEWRGGEWRGGERGGEWRGGGWGERGEERWPYGGEWRDEWRGGGRGEWGRERAGAVSGEGYGRFGERSAGGARWRGESGEYGEPRGPSFGAGSMYGGPGGEYGGGPTGGGMYGGISGRMGRGVYPGGGRGEYTTFGSRTGEGGGWGRQESDRELGRYMRRYGEEDQGPFERMGEKIREGVRKLTGRGPKGYRRSDERIREEVSERIARSWVNAEDVEVKVEKGEVTLTGLVASREEKRTLEDIAEDVFGVDEVNNHLRIRREERAPSTAGKPQMQTQAGQQGTQRAIGTQGSHSQPGRH